MPPQFLFARCSYTSKNMAQFVNKHDLANFRKNMTPTGLSSSFSSLPLECGWTILRNTRGGIWGI